MKCFSTKIFDELDYYFTLKKESKKRATKVSSLATVLNVVVVPLGATK